MRLGEVVVEGDRTIIAFGRLAEFYRRRRSGFGRFITSWDIERRRPFYVSDLLRQVPGLSVTYGGFGRPVVRSRRGMSGFGGSCSPMVFLDGMRLAQDPDLGMELDDVTVPEHVAGIEIYTGPAQVPPEFNVSGSQCGVIAVWTK
ncbi:MAG TPA: TonB-dependent receptor plug domain-containing protein [Gemmatimonadales bacterium]